MYTNRLSQLVVFGVWFLSEVSTLLNGYHALIFIGTIRDYLGMVSVVHKDTCNVREHSKSENNQRRLSLKCCNRKPVYLTGLTVTKTTCTCMNSSKGVITLSLYIVYAKRMK